MCVSSHLKALAMAVFAAGMGLGLSVQAGVVISDSFGGPAGALNGRKPEVDTTSPDDKWVAADNFNTTGSALVIGDSTGNAMATLAFKPVTGTVYDLQLTVTNATGEANTGHSLALGFVTGEKSRPTDYKADFSTVTAGWMGLRCASGSDVKLGDGTCFSDGFNNGQVWTGDGSLNHTFALRLDTTGDQWKASVLVDGTQKASWTYTTNHSITGVFIGQSASASATVSKFQLTTK